MLYRLCKILFLVICAPATIYAQKRDTITHLDTNQKLNEVTVRGYLSVRPLLNVPASVALLSAQQLGLQSGSSLVTAMNSIPGVRMEERSPGSYRLAIRGSLIRSPFGVRDVKIYFDEIPLTDAGGNTYLNNIDVNSINSIEVLKGPDGSLFGANTSGVVLINPFDKHADSTLVSGGINGGSYGLVHQNSSFQTKAGNNLLSVAQAYQNYDGYRQNSAMQRNYLQAVDRWTYATFDDLRAIAFYSDLQYQTPGGLTLAQEQADPQDARLATKTTASAQDLKAAIYSKMLFGGLVNNIYLGKRLRNVFTVFGTHVDFTNPSFTTYERRLENTFGLRTYFELVGRVYPQLDWKINLGGEWQQTNSDIGDYGNNLGNMDTTQTHDLIHTIQSFIFTRFEGHLYKKLTIEAALSLNNYQYQFLNVYPLAQTAYINRPFTAQLMPRLALSYRITDNFIWRASLSRGYSTPAIGEVRPTDHTINTSLQAEDGYNYETGFRLRSADERFFLDVSAYYFRLNNTIIQLSHPDGTNYYANVGGTNQPGVELAFTGWLVKQNGAGFIRGLQFNQSYAYNNFTFRDYSNGTATYSGNQLTGTPKQNMMSSVYILLPRSFYLFTQFSFTDKLPLDDGNTVYAPSYSLLGGKAGWKHRLYGKTEMELYVGADNLLNQNYSLGDDLNAAAGRYYNPAPRRNFYGGIAVKF